MPVAFVNQVFTGTIPVAGATFAQVTNLPAGATQSWAAGNITVTWTPTAQGVFGPLLVTATNACGSGTAGSLAAQDAGSITVGPSVPSQSLPAAWGCAGAAPATTMTYSLGATAQPITGVTGVTVTGVPTATVATVGGVVYITVPSGVGGPYTATLQGAWGSTGPITLPEVTTIPECSTQP